MQGWTSFEEFCAGSSGHSQSQNPLALAVVLTVLVLMVLVLVATDDAVVVSALAEDRVTLLPVVAMVAVPLLMMPVPVTLALSDDNPLTEQGF